MIDSNYFLKKAGLREDAMLVHMISAFKVEEAYEGDEPYIFVSYAHKDSGIVIPTIKAIQEKGYPLWYDAGIKAGSEWPEEIASHLLKASFVLVFLSRNSVASTYCRAEITGAINYKKPILTVNLDNAPLPPGLELQLNNIQRFNAFVYDSGEEMIDELVNATAIANAIPPALKEILEKKRRKAEEAERLRREAEAEAERKQKETEAKRREDAETERKRREAEEMERMRIQIEVETRLRIEAEMAEKRRQKEEMRRKAAEEAEERRREAEEIERRRQEARRRKEEEEAEKERQEAEKKDKREKMREQFRLSKAQLRLKTVSGYREAVCLYNEGKMTHAWDDAVAMEEAQTYKVQLCEAIYQEACRLEKSMRARRSALRLLMMLPVDYKDSLERKGKLQDAESRVDRRCAWLYSILFLGLNVIVTRFWLRSIDLWYLKLFAAISPMVLVATLVLINDRALHRLVPDDTCGALMLCVVITVIMDPFLFQNMSIFSRILWSLGYNILSGLVFFVALMFSSVIENKDQTIMVQE